MALPNFNTSDRVLSMLQDQWSAQINPILVNPIMQGRMLTNVSLAAGSNTINTLLGRKLQGWFPVGQNAAATFYDTQSTNQMQDKTLVLVASAPCIASFWVF